jgi:hypothetical protein
MSNLIGFAAGSFFDAMFNLSISFAYQLSIVAGYDRKRNRPQRSDRLGLGRSNAAPLLGMRWLLLLIQKG